MLTGGICVSRRDNAIHNISIPGGDIDPRRAAVWRRCRRDFVTYVMVAGSGPAESSSWTTSWTTKRCRPDRSGFTHTELVAAVEFPSRAAWSGRRLMNFRRHSLENSSCCGGVTSSRNHIIYGVDRQFRTTIGQNARLWLTLCTRCALLVQPAKCPIGRCADADSRLDAGALRRRGTNQPEPAVQRTILRRGVTCTTILCSMLSPGPSKLGAKPTCRWRNIWNRVEAIRCDMPMRPSGC